MEAKKPLVVVLSRNHSVGLGVVRALGEAGYTVDVVSSAHRTGASELIAKSKYVRNHTEIVSRKKADFDEHPIMEVLNSYIENDEEPAVLIPTDDYTLAIADMNRDILKDHFIMPHASNERPGVLVEYMDYIFQHKLADQVGFNQHKEWFIDLKKIEIPEDLVYPCMCKPCDIITSSTKDKVIFEDEINLKIHLNTLRRKNDERSVVLYEVINVDGNLELDGLAFGEEVIIPAAAKFTEYAQYNNTVAVSGQMVSVEEYKAVYEKAVNMIKALNYTGMFSLDLYVCEGKLYFDQLYLRSGLVNHVYNKCGANLPAAYVERITGKTETTELTADTDKNFVFDNVVRKDFRKELIDEEQMAKFMAEGAITIISDAEDTAPEDVERPGKRKKSRKKKTLKRRIKKAIKRYIFPILRPIKHRLYNYPQMDPANARNPESERPRVIVSGRNYGSNLCIARAIGKAGYEVEVLRIFHRKPKKRQILKKIMPDAYSKYIKAFRVCVYGGKSKRVVKRLISMADPDRKMLIVPADDLVACIIDDYYDELSQYFVLPNVNNRSGEINRLMSKGVQKDLALKAGLPVVNSCIIQTVDGMFEIPETVAYPCFIKPNISKNGSKTKMRRCDSEQELRDALTELSEKKDVEMLVEDFVEIGREYSILGVSTKNGAIGPGFFGAEEGGKAEHRGVAVTGQVLPCSMWQELIDDTVKFVGSLGFDGLYDVDFIETVDGKVYFVEVNMRFGGSGYAITESGVNLPGMFADYMLLGKPIDMDCKLEEPGKRFVSEKVLIEEYVKNRISMARVNEIMDDVDIHFIKNSDDPLAFRHFKKFYKIAAILRVIYRIKDGTDSEFGK